MELNRGFVDCGIVWRSSFVRRMIGRIYSANWGDIVLESERSGSGSLCISSGENHNLEDSGHMDLGRKDYGLNRNMDGACRTDFGGRGELVVCEELSRLLQKTYYKRLITNDIWKKQIGKWPGKSATG